MTMGTNNQNKKKNKSNEKMTANIITQKRGTITTMMTTTGTKKRKTKIKSMKNYNEKRKNNLDSNNSDGSIKSIHNLLFSYLYSFSSNSLLWSSSSISSIFTCKSSTFIFILLFIINLNTLYPFIFIVNASSITQQQQNQHHHHYQQKQIHLNSSMSNSGHSNNINNGQYHSLHHSMNQSQKKQQQSHSTRSYLPTIDGHQKAIPPNIANNLAPSSFGSCTSPEVMVNGSPSPDIAGTVSGGQLGSIEEIQFVGIVAGGHNNDNNNNSNGNRERSGRSIIKQKRVCKIKCLNGVWIGPLCAFQNVDEYEPVLRPCRVPTIANGSVVIVVDGSSPSSSSLPNKSNKNGVAGIKSKKELSHGSIIKVKCKEIGLFKLSSNGDDNNNNNGGDTLQCVDGLWDSVQIPYCQPTTLHMNFSLTSPPSILYTLLDGTLGINDYDHQLVILPGAIVHLDCVFQETFGQPQWSVTAIPGFEDSSMLKSDPNPNDNDDQDNSVQQNHLHQVFDYTEQKQHHNQYQSNTQYIGNQHLSHRRRGYYRKHHHQQQPGSNQDVKTHTTGWAILTDKQSWKYRLAIYYASESDTGRYTCTTPNGQTNHIDIVVKDVQCPSLDEMAADQDDFIDPNRLASKTGIRMHDRIRFSCLNGYHLRGKREVKCMPNGQWSHPFPKCQEISCPDYGIPDGRDPNLFVTLEYRKEDDEEEKSQDDDDDDGDGINDGKDDQDSLSDPINFPWNNIENNNNQNNSNNDRQALRFRCPLGYRLLGPSLIICNEQNQWSEPFPTCQQLTCQEPELPLNVQIMKSTNGRYLVGDYIQYGCRKGFKMIGQDIATCLQTEQWSSPPPICKQVCSYPAKLMRGYYEPVKFYYEIGESVSIHCNDGYRLVKEFDDGQPPNSNITTCGSDGLWIGQAVKCKRLVNKKNKDQDNKS